MPTRNVVAKSKFLKSILSPRSAKFEEVKGEVMTVEVGQSNLHIT